MTAATTTPDATADRERKIKKYVAANGKSQLVALFLALLFGPIGYLYASPLGGAIMILLAVALGSVDLTLAVLIWLACLVLAPLSAIWHNDRVRAQAELMLP
jgi:putative Ca2+/H+ antiporter (TMEM165/GDT1 family)